MKKAIIFTVALALIGSAVAVAVHYKHKHEDDVAYFALRAIHAQADSVDCKAVADASYQEHCLSAKNPVELRNYMQTHTQAETLTESFDCITRNFSRWTDAQSACYRQKDEEEARYLEQWTEKYPRQAANMKRDALENARKRDAKAAEAK